MIEEQSLCHHCEHGRPENWCAEFGIDMQMIESCSAFSKATEESNSSSMACYVSDSNFERLIDHAARLGLALTRDDPDIANESWRCLPPDLQAMLDVQTEAIESELDET